MVTQNLLCLGCCMSAAGNLLHPDGHVGFGVAFLPKFMQDRGFVFCSSFSIHSIEVVRHIHQCCCTGIADPINVMKLLIRDACRRKKISRG